MSANRLSINGQPYTVADESRLKIGRRSVVERLRPSQPSESLINTRTWALAGPIGNSRQERLGDPLGPDYTIDLDGRNRALLTSAIAKNQVTLANALSPAKVPPTTTVQVTNWAETNSGGTDGNAHNELDSYDSPDDSTYWSTSTLDAELIVGLAAQTDPGIDTGHVVRARVTAPDGNTGTVGVKLRLYDSTTPIATSGETTIDPIKTVTKLDGWTTGETAAPVHSITSGANRLLLAVVSTDDGAGDNFNDLTAMSYGGQAMTQYGEVASTFGGQGDRRVEVWYLLETAIQAASGTTLSTTWSEGSPPGHGYAISLATFENVDQTTPIGDDATAKDTQSLTMSGLAVSSGDFVVAGAAIGYSNPGSWTGTAGYTEQLDYAAPDSNHHLQDKAITADGTETVTATFDQSSSNRAVGLAVVIQGQGNATPRTQNVELTVPASAIATLSSHSSLRIAVLASTVAGSDVVRVSEMQFELPQLDVNDVIAIDEQDGQLFAHRGDQTAQINPGDMTEVGSPEDHNSTITGSIASHDGEGYVLFGDAIDVKRRTAVTSAGATYASVTGVKATHAAIGPDRLWFVEADGGADDGQVKYVFDAWTSAGESNGIRVADTNSGHITGLYTLGLHMVAGTKRGPRSFTDDGSPAVLGEAVKAFPSELNGAAGDSLWGWHYHATQLGLNAVQPDGPIENPVGPGEGLEGQSFEGPIDGYPIAVRAFKDSLWVSYLSSEGDSWLLRGVFNPRTTPGSGRPDWYVVRKLSGVACRAIGATTGRQTVPALVWGENANVFYADLAYRGREIADPNYRYATNGAETNGQWFGTTLMLTQGLVGNVRWAKFFTENCNTSNTWRLAVSLDEGSYVDVGSGVTTNGLQTVRPTSSGSPLSSVSFSTLKPRLTQVAASNTAPPQIRGELTIAFDERPEYVREVDVLIEVSGGELQALQSMVGVTQTVPVPIRLPSETAVNANSYGHVVSAEWFDRTSPSDSVAQLKLVMWATS